MITPAPLLRRNPAYRLGGKFYGQSNSITGPLILGGILKKAGHQVEAYEELNGAPDYRKLLRTTDVFCLYTMTSNAPRAYELADRIHKESGARVLIGGIHATAMPEEAAQHADQVIVGEGESAILDAVEGRLPGKIVSAHPPENLDDVPFPDYSILRTPCKSANILTTRGCPFRCTFCTTSRMFAPYRQRSVENVMEEIRMYRRMGFRYMNFEDDNFTADKERAKEICRRIIAEKLQFRETFFFGRTDMADDEELLELLSQAHLSRVLMGIESLNQAALDSIHKCQSIRDIERAAAACKAHRIRLIASIVLGLDEDASADIRRSVEFAKSIDAYQLQPAVLTPYPGTPVYEQFQRERRIITDDWTLFDMMNVTFQPRQMTPWELQEEFYRAATSFYSFRSAPRIGRLFGAQYGWRRFGLALCAHMGSSLAQFVSNHAKTSYYYRLRHGPLPKGQPAPEGGRA
jgi:Fe-S oxidoreductase